MTNIFEKYETSVLQIQTVLNFWFEVSSSKYESGPKRWQKKQDF